MLVWRDQSTPKSDPATTTAGENALFDDIYRQLLYTCRVSWYYILLLAMQQSSQSPVRDAPQSPKSSTTTSSLEAEECLARLDQLMTKLAEMKREWQRRQLWLQKREQRYGKYLSEMEYKIALYSYRINLAQYRTIIIQQQKALIDMAVSIADMYGRAQILQRIGKDS